MSMDIQGQPQAREVIQPELREGEQILWAGVPKPGIRLSPIDILLVPMSLASAIIPTIIGIHVFLSFRQHSPAGGPFSIFDYLPLLFIIPFVFSGLSLSVGRFIRIARWKRSVYFAVTNQRAIMLSMSKGKQVNSKPLLASTAMSKYVRKDGSGTITFGDTDGYSQAAMSGFAFLSPRILENVVLFMDIPDVEQVNSVINGVIGNQQAQSAASENPLADATLPETPLPFAPNRRSVSSLGKLRLTFGSPGSIFGWVWFGFSMIFFWLAAMNADYTPLYYWTGNQVASGRIVNVRDMGWKVGGDRSGGGSPVYEYKYEFMTAHGRTYSGMCKTSGIKLAEGSKINVEYLSHWPAKSRIAGVSKNALPWYVGVFVLIFPTIGILIIYASLKSGRKDIRLLEEGRAVYGTLKSKETIRSDKSTQYKLVFEFAADNGTRQKVETTVSDLSSVTDQAHELVLYNPAKPSEAAVVDSMTGSPTIDDMGNVHLKRAGVGIVGLLLALGMLLAHGSVIWMRFFK